ncbi:transposable element Tcb1 transposase [Trichonephila clavipes]|nr:transposable element Tcb1 transposase [Trichonephila clavipes]
MHRYTGPAFGIMVWSGIGFHCRTPLVCSDDTLNSQRYISEVLEPVVLPYIQSLPSTIFQHDNVRPHVGRSVQEFFFTHQIELLPWPACFPDLARDTPPAATPDQLCLYLEAAWTVVPEGYIQSLYDSMPRRVGAVIANNGGYTYF